MTMAKHYIHSEIEKQRQFVEWLKAKGLYNEFESAATMVKLHRVWEAAISNTDSQDARRYRGIKHLFFRTPTGGYWELLPELKNIQAEHIDEAIDKMLEKDEHVRENRS